MAAAAIFFVLVFTGLIAAQSSAKYEYDIASWRIQHVNELAADDGWLTVAGLFWLKEGVNSVGVGNGPCKVSQWPGS